MKILFEGCILSCVDSKRSCEMEDLFLDRKKENALSTFVAKFCLSFGLGLYSYQ